MPLGSNSVTIGQVTAMTVITPIIPGKLGVLQQVLAQPLGAVLKKISTIHFARWVIINQGADLLFTSNFDGGWQDYLKDFTDATPDGLDAIWSNCVDYPGCQNFNAFLAYVDQHEIKTNLFYPAYPDLMVKDILKQQKVYALAEKAVGPMSDLLNEFG